MKIIIEAEVKEIADLVTEIQDRRIERNKRNITISYDPLASIRDKINNSNNNEKQN